MGALGRHAHSVAKRDILSSSNQILRFWIKLKLSTSFFFLLFNIISVIRWYSKSQKTRTKKLYLIINHFSVQVLGILPSLFQDINQMVCMSLSGLQTDDDSLEKYIHHQLHLNCVYDILKNHDRMIRFIWLMLVLLQSGERHTSARPQTHLVLIYFWNDQDKYLYKKDE